jgi:putative membrane protein
MGKVNRQRERSILKGALAGLVGGILGSGAWALAERIGSPSVAKDATAQLDPDQPLNVAAKPWLLGPLAGAAYGAAMEIEPKAGTWQGAGFGLALKKLADQAVPPQAGAAELSVRRRTQQRQSEWVSYAVFGVVTEAVRRLVRRGL